MRTAAAIFFLTACQPIAPKIDSKGITNAGDATAALGELTATLLAISSGEALIGGPARQRSGTGIRCDKGDVSVTKHDDRLTYGLFACAVNDRTLTGTVTWSLEVTRSNGVLHGEASFDGSVALVGPVFSGNFELRALAVSFIVAGPNAAVTVDGSWHIGGKSFAIDDAAFATAFADVYDPPATDSIAVRINGPDPRGATPSPCAALTLDSFEAELLIEGREADACPLSIVTAGSGFGVRGTCYGVPTGSTRVLTLRWFVRAPEHGNAVTIAQSIGQADLLNPESGVVEVVFDATIASLKPKTKGLPTEAPAEKLRFNCDRTSDLCDSETPPQESSMPESDTCSNLEELCAGTLFSNAANQCSSG